MLLHLPADTDQRVGEPTGRLFVVDKASGKPRKFTEQETGVVLKAA